MSIVMISESLLLKTTATDGRILRDRMLSGFGVRLNARKRTFLIATSVSGKQFRMMLGYWPLMTVDEARSHAMTVLRQCRNGERPSRKVKTEAPTLRAALMDYCTTKGIKASSQRRYDSIFRTHFGDWLDRSVQELGSGAFSEHCHAFAKAKGSALVEVGRGVVTALIKYVNANALEKRPELRKALELCRKSGATLLIAKLDRLARNVHFVSGLMESKVKFVACDLPEANQLTIHIMAAFAEHEARRISERTRDALAAAKARGVILGATGPANLKRHTQQRQDAACAFTARLMPVLNGFMAQGLSRRAMVVQLNDLGIKAPRGGAWSLGQVQRVINLPLAAIKSSTSQNAVA